MCVSGTRSGGDHSSITHPANALRAPPGGRRRGASRGSDCEQNAAFALVMLAFQKEAAGAEGGADECAMCCALISITPRLSRG